MCKSVQFWFVVTICLLAPPLTLAQIEEIAVTAQIRAESLGEVPIAVTVFTNEAIEALGITDASDLVDLTPGLSARQQSGSNRNYFLRGVGTNDFHLTSAPAVGQYFDEVTLTSGFHAKVSLFDMERVEVLKGPQNALFGLNTTGGAVNYISVKPEIDRGTHGHINTRLGNQSLISLDGALGFDISDNVSARVSGFWNLHDGAFDSSFDATDFGDNDTQAARAQVLWQISDTTDVLLNVHVAQSASNGTAKRGLGSREPGGTHNLCADFSNQVNNFGGNTSCVTRNEGPDVPAGGATPPGVVPSGSGWEDIGGDIGREDLDTRGVYLKINHDISWATFTSLTAFDNLKFQAGIDFDASDLGLQVLQQEDDRDTFQQEFRLVSTGDGAFRWIAGVYYLDEEAGSYTGVRSQRPPFVDFSIVGAVALDHAKENLGVYGQGELDLSDSLTLTVGARWSDEELNGDYMPSSPDVSAFSAQTLFFRNDILNLTMQQGGFDPARLVSNRLTNEDIGFTAKLDYSFAEDSLVYGSFSRGFKGGALDIRAFFSRVPVVLIPTILANSNLDPESLDAWELGYKDNFADGNVQFDAAVFYYDYQNLQQFTTAAGLPALANAPESEITGLDVNIKYANATGFYAQAGISLLDSEIKDGGIVFLNGAALSNTPELSWTALISKDLSIGNGTLTMMANASYTDERFVETLQQGPAAESVNKLQIVDEYTLANASAVYRFGDDENLSVGAYVHNITDEKFCLDIRADDTAALVSDGGVAHTFTVTCSVSNASTRRYGVSFGYAF